MTFGEYEEVEDVSCGYGFTLLATNSASKKRLFGTGFNQSGQIGYHERSRGKPLGKKMFLIFKTFLNFREMK